MTDAVGNEVDPRLEYLPRILIITTNGVEIDLLLPPSTTANIHWTQVWRPVPCRCGAIHAPCDAADLALVVGPRDRAIHHHPEAFVVYVVPRPMKKLPENAVQVVYSGTDRFGPWATDVVLNLVGPLAGAIWSYRLTDLKAMMIRARSWSCVSASGERQTIADEIVDRIPSSAQALHVSMCLPDDLTIDFADVFETLTAIQAAVRQDASIIVSTSWGQRLVATAILTSDG